MEFPAAPESEIRGEFLARLLPHAGRMCLLDAVLRWDDQQIVCRARDHRASDHPLRHAGRLHAVTAAEYAGQAIAIHGSLRAGSGEAPRRGYLGRLSRLEFSVPDLDSADGVLAVAATLVAQTLDAASYDFEVSAPEQWIARGRVLIAFA